MGVDCMPHSASSGILATTSRLGVTSESVEAEGDQASTHCVWKEVLY
jgi:hypothetical protein